MKKSIIFISFAIIALFASCAEDDSLIANNPRHIVITAEMPDDNITRASLTQKDGSLDMLAQLDEDDELELVVEQDGKIYHIDGTTFFDRIPISKLSDNKKTCTFEFDLREEVDPNRPYTLYGVVGMYNIVIGDIDEKDVALAYCSIGRSAGTGISLYFKLESGKELKAAKFKHFTAYELLHVTNTDNKPLYFEFGGYEAADKWYYMNYSIYFPDCTIMGDDNYIGNGYGPQKAINPGETKHFLSSYVPTGKKMSNARIRAIVNGNEITSSNTKSSDVNIEIGKAYHMYAIWDGKELKFGKEDIHETIIYPTSSYELSEDGKTLIKWLGDETEIDLSADPAFDKVEIIDFKAFAWSRANSIKLSNNVKKIEKWAFDYAHIGKIYLPKSLSFIGDEAFYDCEYLEEVHIEDLSAWCKIHFSDVRSNPLTYARSLYLKGEKVVNLVIPSNVDKIENICFHGADIETLTMSDNVTEIGKDAFSFCENLNNIQFSSNLFYIGYCAFRSCTSLEEIWLPESLNYIGDLSFDLCKNIRTIYIGKNLQYIYFPFRCSNLKNFIVSNQNKNLFAEDGVLYSNVYNYSDTKEYSLDHVSLACYPGGRSDKSFTLPDFATDIQDYAFMQSKSLTTIILHSGMTEIGALTYLFNNTEVPNLEKVIIYATTPPSSYSGVSGTEAYEYGYGVNPNTTLYVPSESIEAYKADQYWRQFKTILPIDGGMPIPDNEVIGDGSGDGPVD